MVFERPKRKRPGKMQMNKGGDFKVFCEILRCFLREGLLGRFVAFILISFQREFFSFRFIWRFFDIFTQKSGSDVENPTGSKTTFIKISQRNLSNKSSFHFSPLIFKIRFSLVMFFCFFFLCLFV